MGWGHGQRDFTGDWELVIGLRLIKIRSGDLTAHLFL